MNDLNEVALTSSIKNGRRRLIAGGIIQIIAGMLCAMGAALTILGLLIMGDVADETATPFFSLSMAFAIFFYAAISVWLITVGLGSINMKRWARALSLIVAWTGLIIGANAIIAMVLFMPDFFQLMDSKEGIPPNVQGIVAVITMIMMACVYVIFPGVMVLLYSGKRVKQACEYYNPQPSWADSRPLPVLAACFLFFFQAFGMLPMMFFLKGFPLFGLVIGGPAGILLVGLTVLLLLVIALGLYRLRLEAWWGAIIATLFLFGSFTVTFFRMDSLELMKLMDMSEQEIEALNMGSFLDSPAFTVQMVGSIVILLAFLLFIRRYFRKPEGPEEIHVS